MDQLSWILSSVQAHDSDDFFPLRIHDFLWLMLGCVEIPELEETSSYSMCHGVFFFFFFFFFFAGETLLFSTNQVFYKSWLGGGL